MSARTAQKSRVRVKPFDRSNSTFPVHVALLLPAVGEEIGATKLVDRPNPVGRVSSLGVKRFQREQKRKKKRDSRTAPSLLSNRQWYRAHLG